ncbi:MAG: iron ABC transporter permease [Bacteroidales bacterium]|nr:iron ABC transporter permease [Bacteroidales bacterium]MCM1146483.1 iron ABC transporter permease [Bacteroidales bacterium]MCM1205079.1 iron ABC transporter permease [Bacillota bacterium]MCM1509325.1 iron ABC transporter permease [Clostridium sp.]
MLRIAFCFILLTVLSVASLLYGSVDIPAEQVFRVLAGGYADKESWTYIIIESRLPQTITALLCGAALATSGLLLQTGFRNPLAGPSILGISSGASLGVAIVTLLSGGVLSAIAAAFGGAMAIIIMLLIISTVVRSSMTLLIVGIMINYLTSSVVSLCNFFAKADNVQAFVFWGMGSFSDVGLRQLPAFAACCITGLVISATLVKRLNAILVGETYAASLGVNVSRTRWLTLLSTGLLTAASTAFCGPIAFIGLAVPHIARFITGTSNHKTLLPATMFCGAAIAVACNIICALPENLIIPVNTITPIFGAPVIIYTLFIKKAKR